MTRMTDEIGYGALGRDLTELIRETRPELLCPQRQPCRRRSRIAAALAALIAGMTITLLLTSPVWFKSLGVGIKQRRRRIMPSGRQPCPACEIFGASLRYDRGQCVRRRNASLSGDDENDRGLGRSP